MKAIFKFKGFCCGNNQEVTKEFDGEFDALASQIIAYILANYPKGHGFEEMHLKIIRPEQTEVINDGARDHV